MASEFVREERYIVVKINKLTDDQRHELTLFCESNLIPWVEGAVVVEADWPEYERVWEMIERRVLRGHLVGGISYYPEAME